MTFKWHLLALFLLPTWHTSIHAASCSAQTAKVVTPLLELYTSEGCSSCPPADLWLSRLKSRPGELNALAFHVDYWDGLGWKDRFAQQAFSEKQRIQAKLTGNRVVYTNGIASRCCAACCCNCSLTCSQGRLCVSASMLGRG